LQEKTSYYSIKIMLAKWKFSHQYKLKTLPAKKDVGGTKSKIQESALENIKRSSIY
jgi:hypothetical protein